MKRNIIFLAIAAFCMSSCSTYMYTSRQIAIERRDITAAPTIVDVKADYTKRLVETSSRCKTPEQAQQEARYLAITNGKCDIVVDPVYKIEKHGRKYKATITGFAGYYTNSRTFYEDLKLLHDIDKEDIEKYLILHNPEVIKYMNQTGEVVNIYHNDRPARAEKADKAAHADKAEPAPAPAPVSVPTQQKGRR